MTEAAQIDRALLAKRLQAADKARDDLLTFARYMSPDPNDPDDVGKSTYEVEKVHKVICAALEQVEAGLIPRLILSLPPRTGKSTLASRLFPVWYMGKNPANHVMLATYNETFSEDFGRNMRFELQSPLYQQVFPEIELKAGAKSAKRLMNTKKGVIMLLGRKGSATGRGGDLILIDDPIKNREEADSETIREQMWTWFNQVIKTRMMTERAAIVIIMTRWHADDLVGRITDETNPNYNAEEAKLWKVINIPAIADEDDPLGREPGEPLWPGRFGRTYLERIRAADPRGFQALYQGDPTPPDGMMIPMSKLVVYKKDDRLDRSEMRFYGASDMAVSDGSRADKTCHMIFGVDNRDRIWVMPEIFWEKSPSDVSIEKMIDLMERYKPLLWFCESGQIQKSLGPFLRKRMSERRVYCALHESFSAKDKATRAQSIVARMSMGLVRFPNYSWWWPQARDEMTKFPNGRYDDLVDALSLFGLGLDYVSKMRPSKNPLSVPYDPAVQKVGSVAWIKAAAKRDEMRQKLARDVGGW